MIKLNALSNVRGAFAVIIILSISLCGGVRAADPASANFSINASSFGNGSVNSSSPVYVYYAGIQQYPGIQLSSLSFSSGSGFATVVYGSASLGPTVLSIDPSSGYNIAPIHIAKILGTNFSSAVVVKLSCSGEADIAAKNVNFVSATELNCDFDIAGIKAAKWDVVVTKEGESASILSQAFEIESYSYASSIAFNSPNPFDPARETTTIVYKLDKDTDVNVYLFSITANMIWKDTFLAGSSGGKLGENSIIWNGISAFGEMMSNGVYLLHVVEKGTGKTLAKGKIMVLRR